MKKKNYIWYFVNLISAIGFQSLVFADAEMSKGVGPISSLKLEKVDSAMAASGKKTFEAKCSACHKLSEKYVGPALKDVTKRRSPEWVMNMILNPVEMTEKDPVAQDLLSQFLTQMTFQNVSKDDARAILEYFREVDEGKSAAAPTEGEHAKKADSKGKKKK